MKSQRPTPSEYAPYFEKYVDLISSDDILPELKRQNLQTFMKGLNEDQWSHAYAPGKWTVKESILHIIDTERVFAYRALRIARNDKTEMPGFDQDHFAKFSDANERTAQSLAEEFQTVRGASCFLFENMTQAAMGRTTVAGGNPCSARALAYMIMGHQEHHLTLFKEKYNL